VDFLRYVALKRKLSDVERKVPGCDVYQVVGYLAVFQDDGAQSVTGCDGGRNSGLLADDRGSGSRRKLLASDS
jgi:hypothetical protein